MQKMKTFYENLKTKELLSPTSEDARARLA
jgi:hypothetical protein